jgi:hypothetical protein
VDLHFGDADQFFVFELKESESQFKELRKKVTLKLETIRIDGSHL